VDLSGLKLPVQITELGVRGDRLVADGRLMFGRGDSRTRGERQPSRSERELFRR
jgi:hypothetical protein